MVAVRISADDERRINAVLKAQGVKKPKLGSYCYEALMAQLAKDERRLGRAKGQ